MKRYILLLVGICTLVYFIASFFDPNQNPVGLGSDGYEYWHLSTSLLKHKTFSYTDISHYPIFDLNTLSANIHLPKEIPCTVRVPGYPFILAAARTLWDSPWVAILINIMAYIGMCFYGFRLGDLLIPSTIFRRIFNVLLIFQPLVFVRWGIGADILCALFLTGFTYHALKIYQNTSQPALHIFFSILWGIAANLTRSNLLIFTLSLIAGFILSTILTKNRRPLPALLLIFILLSAVIAAWMVRNKNLTDALTLSTQGGAVFYTVHLAYELPESNPLSIWKKTAKAKLIDNALNQGYSFNRAEVLLDNKLKSVVKEYYNAHPTQLFKKLMDGLRTMFFFSYFDISDAVMLSRHNAYDRFAFANSSSSEAQNYTPKEKNLRNALFQLSRVYKWLIALLFLAFPLALCLPQLRSNIALTSIWPIYSATFLSIIMTALFTGAGGDRMRLPFAVVILLFCSLSLALPTEQTKINGQKT